MKLHNSFTPAKSPSKEVVDHGWTAPPLLQGILLNISVKMLLLIEFELVAQILFQSSRLADLTQAKNTVYQNTYLSKPLKFHHET